MTCADGVHRLPGQIGFTVPMMHCSYHVPRRSAPQPFAGWLRCRTRHTSFHRPPVTQANVLQHRTSPDPA
ncbi:hypothetical protein [Xylella fastidiosa]|uniref:hypothetical protein n=1 Tax=Xylella fastidiosa TaxID=2371 RepID=UPI0018C65156|nr:hypothetical protein [Xylella fastidiosa]